MAAAKSSGVHYLRRHAAVLLARLTCTRAVAALLALLGGYLLCVYVYEETYVWQSTSLAQFLRPVQRTSCELPGRASAVIAVCSRMAVVMIYDAAFDRDPKLTARLLQNRQRYCDKHGYTMIVARQDELDPSRPPAWSKLLVVRRHLLSQRFDYVAYLDMDAVVMDPSFCLCSLAARLPEADFVMTSDWSGLNTGVFLAKATPFAAAFLQLAWDEGAALLGKTCPQTGRRRPFEYEQRAFHFLLQTPLWRGRGLPAFQGATPDMHPSKTAAHFALVPQCAMNSYALHPLDSRLLSGLARVEESQWVGGDFVVHLAGKKGREKVCGVEVGCV